MRGTVFPLPMAVMLVLLRGLDVVLERSVLHVVLSGHKLYEIGQLRAALMCGRSFAYKICFLSEEQDYFIELWVQW